MCHCRENVTLGTVTFPVSFILSTSRWVRKVTLLNCNLHFKDNTNEHYIFDALNLNNSLAWVNKEFETIVWCFRLPWDYYFSWTFGLAASLACSQEMVYGRCYCCYNCGTEQYVFFEKTHFSIFPIISNIFYPILDLSNYIQFCFYFFELSTTTKTLHFLGKVCCWQRVFSRN